MMDLFGKAAAVTTPSRLDCMNPAGLKVNAERVKSLDGVDAHLIKALASNVHFVEKFAHQIALYSKLQRKPEDILRRFSLNGDNKLDLKEFQPALKRLFGHEITHAQSKEIFTAFCPTSGKKLDIDIFCQIMNHWSSLTSAKVQDRTHFNFVPKANNTIDTSANLRRGLELATLNYDKLNDMFLKMDIGCTGYLTKEEFELAMSHLGIYLTLQEYEQMYAQLPSSVLNPKGIFYGGFLAMLGIKMSSLFQNQKIWENLLANSDSLRCQLNAMLKQGAVSISAHQLREALSNCGVTLSNSDFTGLRMRLQSYTDATGEIQILSLLDALNDKAASVLHGTSVVAPASPLKRGKKKACEEVGGEVAAGKTTEQRNAEANHSLVKMTDHKSKTEFGQTFLQPPVNSPVKESTTLEQRIVQKLQAIRESGPSQYASIANVFPADRFGKITRGLLRQSLSHLGIVTRQADIEALFWKLDPHGQGYILAKMFYQHIDGKEKLSKDNDTNTIKKAPPVMEYRFFNALKEKIPNIMRICRQIDSGRTGCLSRVDFIWAMQEAGLLMSQSDAQDAISALSTRKDGVVVYDTIEAKLQELDSRFQSTSVHLSNAALLLDQSTNKTLEDKESQSKYQNYSARRSTIVLGHDFLDKPVQEHEKDLTYALQANPSVDPKVKAERLERQTLAKRLYLIQSILEKRSELKLCFDLYPYKPISGTSIVLGLEEIAEIVASARMGLDIATLDDAMTFVQSIVPAGTVELSFVELIRLLNSAHANANHKYTQASSKSEIPAYLRPNFIEHSIQYKLTHESTLKDVNSNRWDTTGSIIVRHAFKGLSSRDMTTVALSGGQYDAMCRNADLKHICYRLSLDLTPQECHFLLNRMGVLSRGFFSSTDLFQCLSSLLFPAKPY